MQTLNRIWITWFYTGLAPKAPGTFGSLGALPLCWAFLQVDSWAIRGLILVSFTALAIYGCYLDQKKSKKKDPSYIVIDEVAGMLWAVSLVDFSYQNLIFAFILFRFFDIMKPYPICLIDRASKKSRNAWKRAAAIVLDDVAAGIVTVLILDFLIRNTVDKIAL